jgi:KUP system potassium uptake protein
MADWFQPFGIIIATMAAVIASQALISGSFTLINEAMRLNSGQKLELNTTEVQGHCTFLLLTGCFFFGCVGIVLHFENQVIWNTPYGLAIILCMIMTTILLNFYLIMKRVKLYFMVPPSLIYLLIELSF